MDSSSNDETSHSTKSSSSDVSDAVLSTGVDPPR